MKSEIYFYGALKHIINTMFMSSVDQCDTDLGRPGYTFAVAGDQAI